MRTISSRCERGKKILVEISGIRSHEILSLKDLEKLALLRVELIQLYPAVRFVWIDAVPVVDLWAEITKLNLEEVV